MKYTAIIIDLKNSRALTTSVREQIQQKVKNIIDILNDVFEGKMKFKVVFSAGDSVQGLFYEPLYALQYLFFLKHLVYPFQIRCGIGYGTIIEGIIDLLADSNIQDGPAYHNAFTSLELCKDQGYETLIFNNHKQDLYLNEMLYIIQTMENNLKTKQRDVNNLINLLNPIDFHCNLKLKRYYDQLNTFIYLNIKQYQSKFELDQESLEIIYKINSEAIITDNLVLDRTSIKPSISVPIKQIIGTSRENIRQIIESGQLNDIKNLRILCLKYLQEYYKEI